MKYKEIIDVIEEIVDGHVNVNQWGYGNISDINTPEDEEPPQYPYIFLNPVSINQDERMATLSANLICMTQTYETSSDELLQQSNCIEYLREVISHINMNLDNPQVEFVLPVTFTPFKERFSDNVVGATATINITYPAPLDDCRNPINPTFVIPQ